MTKPGASRSPEFDNTDRADMTSNADDPQLSIGDEPEEPEIQGEEKATMGLPLHLQLSEKELRRSESLEGILGRDAAILQAVSKGKGHQIIGFWESHKTDAMLADNLKASKAKPASVGQSDDLTELFRDINKHRNEIHPPERPDEAA